eukprot:COSAG01_NODE_50469_length_363_cov_0.765152_1_plen_32_part_01
MAEPESVGDWSFVTFAACKDPELRIGDGGGCV